MTPSAACRQRPTLRRRRGRCRTPPTFQGRRRRHGPTSTSALYAPAAAGTSPRRSKSCRRASALSLLRPPRAGGHRCGESARQFAAPLVGDPGAGQFRSPLVCRRERLRRSGNGSTGPLACGCDRGGIVPEAGSAAAAEVPTTSRSAGRTILKPTPSSGAADAAAPPGDLDRALRTQWRSRFTT